MVDAAQKARILASLDDLQIKSLMHQEPRAAASFLKKTTMKYFSPARPSSSDISRQEEESAFRADRLACVSRFHPIHRKALTARDHASCDISRDFSHRWREFNLSR